MMQQRLTRGETGQLIVYFQQWTFYSRSLSKGLKNSVMIRMGHCVLMLVGRSWFSITRKQIVHLLIFFFSSCFTSIHNPLGYDRHLASLAYMVSPSYIAAKSHKEVVLFQGLGAGVEV